MDEEIQQSRAAAQAAGWTVKTVTNETGRPVYQLHDATGEYIVSHHNESALWKRAFKRGLLADIAAAPQAAPAAPVVKTVTTKPG